MKSWYFVKDNQMYHCPNEKLREIQAYAKEYALVVLDKESLLKLLEDLRVRCANLDFENKPLEVHFDNTGITEDGAEYRISIYQAYHPENILLTIDLVDVRRIENSSINNIF
ncbi:MAG: hypothetical protein LKE54_04465 [Prevotella sp.]|jgi:hypothetical protein|nr:hypothetical protein [Prevotella sp.]MCH3994296.1 hypothetical protein [Prevotella sp.]